MVNNKQINDSKNYHFKGRALFSGESSEVVIIMAEEDIYKVALNSLAAHVAVLDENGVIIETNQAWQDFASENSLSGPIDCVGLNYLSFCDHDKSSRDIGRGIRAVLAGETEEYFTQYPCHSPTEKRWFALRVVKYRSAKENKVIVTHENITPIMKTQKKLEKSRKQLQEQTRQLEETNIALKVLLEQRAQDRVQLEETVYANVHEQILPHLEKLSYSRLGHKERTIVETIEYQLKEIVSPFLNRLSSVSKLLTPQEINVANLVREGKASKDIAEILEISVSGVNFHRKMLRKKLGLSHTKSNLRSYLLSLV
jgi:DNA-binding CsgD family transcriptional regulator